MVIWDGEDRRSKGHPDPLSFVVPCYVEAVTSILEITKFNGKYSFCMVTCLWVSSLFTLLGKWQLGLEHTGNSTLSFPWTSRDRRERVRDSLFGYISVSRESPINWIAGQPPAVAMYSNNIDLAPTCITFYRLYFLPHQIPRIIPDVSFFLAHSPWEGSVESSWCCCYKAKFCTYTSNLSV